MKARKSLVGWAYVALATTLTFVSSAASTERNFANGFQDAYVIFSFVIVAQGGDPLVIPFSATPAAVPTSATYQFSNFNATLETGEPTQQGRMKKTVWMKFHALANRRVVVHTFGSGFNTLLAAYSGTQINALSPLAFNDDWPVTGVSSNQSLIQFNVQAGKDYRIQIGGKGGAEGPIAATISSFPVSGGLSAFLVSAGGTALRGHDYVCLPTNFTPCKAPTFILHNSTNATVTVASSSNLGSGVTAPATINLAAGAVRAVTFNFSPSFDTATARTLSGRFTFTATAGSKVVSYAQVRGLIVVKGNGAHPDTLRADAKPQIHAGLVNQASSFNLNLTNSGTEVAEGCHVRSVANADVKTIWQLLDPSTGKPLQAQILPFNIAPGQKRLVKVSVTSQRDAQAQLTATGGFVVDCANTTPLASTLQNRFSTTNDSHDQPADIDVALLNLPSGVLTVPQGGPVRFSATNRGITRTLVARPKYEHPPGEDQANKQFLVKVCRTATPTGACLQPPAATVRYSAASGSTAYFRVVVTAPATNPGFDVAQRRVFLYFDQDPLIGLLPLPVGAESVAVKRG